MTTLAMLPRFGRARHCLLCHYILRTYTRIHVNRIKPKVSRPTCAALQACIAIDDVFLWHTSVRQRKVERFWESSHSLALLSFFFVTRLETTNTFLFNKIFVMASCLPSAQKRAWISSLGNDGLTYTKVCQYSAECLLCQPRNAFQCCQRENVINKLTATGKIASIWNIGEPSASAVDNGERLGLNDERP